MTKTKRFIFILVKKVVHQIHQKVVLPGEVFQTVEALKHITVTVDILQFQEQEADLLQFEFQMIHHIPE